MQVIGFNLTKISAEKSKDYKKGAISTGIDFKEITNEQVPLIKEDVLGVTFVFTVNYTAGEKDDSKDEKILANITFEGNLLIKATKDEITPILKDWKKKNISNEFKTPLFNAILQKCATRSLDLEEQLNLPFHVPMPQVQLKPKDQA